MPDHLIANLSWQSDYWSQKPTDQDLRDSGHGDPQEYGVLWERYNFNFEKCVRDGRTLGFLICQSRPLSFKDREGIVFFASRGYIVGLYALPTIVSVDWDRFVDFSEEASNISAPLEMCVRWKGIDRVPIDKPRYFAGKKQIRKYIYVYDSEAKAIVSDAIATHRDAPDIQRKLKTVAKSVWGPGLGLEAIDFAWNVERVPFP